MPTYEYVCRACGHEFEEFQSIKADPIAVCPKCRKRKVERKIGTGGAVIFKGSGFYETDYRSESYAKGEKAAKDGESGVGAGAGAPTKEATGDAAKSPAKDAAGDGAKPAAAEARKSAAAADSTVKPEKDASRSASEAAENRRIESRATHPSRIGRGVGNVVRGGAKPAPKSAPKAKPAAAKPRKRG